MTELPRGWTCARLSEICQINPRVNKAALDPADDVTFVPMPAVEAETGNIDVSETRSFEAVRRGYTPFRENDILFAKITPCMENGKIAIVPDLASTYGFGSTEFHVLRPRYGVDPRFVYHAVSNRAFRFHAEHNMTGAVGQKRVPAAILEEHEVGLPPTNEQRRIVERVEALFDEIDKGVESLRAAKTTIGLYRQSLLKSAFEGRLTADWRAANPDKIESSDALLTRIREEREARYEAAVDEWEWATAEWERRGKPGKKPPKPRRARRHSMLGVEKPGHSTALPGNWLLLTAESVGAVQLGRQRSPQNRSKDFPTRYLRAANITEQGLALDDLLDMEFLPHELKAYRLEKGDLLLVEASGSAAQVGKAAIWAGQVPECCFQNTVIRHQPYCRDFAAFLLWLYRYFYATGRFAQVAGGVGINHLSASRFAQIPLPICSSAEQAEIVRILDARFEAVETLEAEIDSSLVSAEALRQSILKKAFAGELVPQDPADEPASVLLARIGAGRADAPAARRRRRVQA